MKKKVVIALVAATLLVGTGITAFALDSGSQNQQRIEQVQQQIKDLLAQMQKENLPQPQEVQKLNQLQYQLQQLQGDTAGNPSSNGLALGGGWGGSAVCPGYGGSGAGYGGCGGGYGSGWGGR
jgi:type VI protein secretion system component VasK